MDPDAGWSEQSRFRVFMRGRVRKASSTQLFPERLPLRVSSSARKNVLPLVDNAFLYCCYPLERETRGNERGTTHSLVRRIREDAAAGKIQRAARAWLARRLVQRMREEELASRAIRSVAVLNIQVRESLRTKNAGQLHESFVLFKVEEIRAHTRMSSVSRNCSGCPNALLCADHDFHGVGADPPTQARMRGVLLVTQEQ